MAVLLFLIQEQDTCVHPRSANPHPLPPPVLPFLSTPSPTPLPFGSGVQARAQRHSLRREMKRRPPLLSSSPSPARVLFSESRLTVRDFTPRRASAETGARILSCRRIQRPLINTFPFVFFFSFSVFFMKY